MSRGNRSSSAEREIPAIGGLKRIVKTLGTCFTFMRLVIGAVGSSVMNSVIFVWGNAEFSKEYSVPMVPRRGVAVKCWPNTLCARSNGWSSRRIDIAVVSIFRAVLRWVGLRGGWVMGGGGLA